MAGAGGLGGDAKLAEARPTRRTLGTLRTCATRTLAPPQRSGAMDLWTSPSDRREPCGPCGQPVGNAKARCPPPDHTFAPLAHEIHRTDNRIFMKKKKTTTVDSGSM